MRKLMIPGILLTPVLFLLARCSEDEETPALRPKIDFKTLTSQTVYADAFVDGEGNSTVDLKEIHAEYYVTILEDLIGSGGGFWDIDATKINNAIEAIDKISKL